MSVAKQRAVRVVVVTATGLVAARGCASRDDATTGETQAVSGTPGCIDITSYPGCTTPCSGAPGAGSQACACPNDNFDDTPAINNAIALAIAGPHVVCIPGGTFDAFIPASGDPRISFNLVGPSYSNLALIGDGPNSIVRMYDPLGGSTCGASGSGFPKWHMFELGGGTSTSDTTSIQFRNLTITSNGLSQPNQQKTFLVEIGEIGQTRDLVDVVLDGVNITGSCGDDIYVQGIDTGASTGLTRGLRIQRSQIGRAGRRGLTINEGVYDMSVADNLFERDNTGAIGLGPTTCSTTPCAPSRIVISRNIFVNDATATVNHIGLTGNDATGIPSNNIVVSDNLLFGGGITTATIANTAIENNVIFGAPLEPVDKHELDIENVADKVSVSGNTIIRTSTIPPVGSDGDVTVYIAKNSLQPDVVSVRGNVVITSVAAAAISMRGPKNQEVTDNLIVQLLSGSPTAKAIETWAPGVNVVSSRIENNVIVGSSILDAVWADAQSTATFANLIVRGNLVKGATNGIEFIRDPGASYLQFPVITGNIFDGATSEVVFNTGLSSTLPNAYVIGGNRGGITQFVGDATPTLTAANGSIYLKRLTSGGSHLYVRQNGAWVAK